MRWHCVAGASQGRRTTSPDGTGGRAKARRTREAKYLASHTALPGGESDPPLHSVGPARTATIELDDLGVSISAQVRLAGITSDVRALFEAAPQERHVDLIERALRFGLSLLAQATEITAADAARVKLAEAMDRVADAAERLDQRHEARTAELEKKIIGLVEQSRAAMSEARNEEQRVREEISRNADELGKAAKALDTSREDLEKKTGAACAGLLEAQGAARDAMLRRTEETLRKLVDPDDPMSAPTAIRGVVEKAASEMRQTTTKNVAELEGKVAGLLGEGSPFAERIAKLAREGAERDIKQVEELLDRLRVELLTDRTRQEHDPTVKGASYEDAVLGLLEPAADAYGLTVQPTAHEIGESAGSKKGDVVLVDENCLPRAAIEARARKNVSLRALLSELEGTATNRGVKIVAYFAHATDCLPSGLREFSRGNLPLTYKRLPNDVHALVAVVDPDDPTVAERLALVMWLIDRLSQSAGTQAGHREAAVRLQEAAPCLEQLMTHLGLFRTIKSGLTKSTGEIDKVRGNVQRLENLMKADLERLEELVAPQ
jgi:hypothetical protein